MEPINIFPNGKWSPNVVDYFKGYLNPHRPQAHIKITKIICFMLRNEFLMSSARNWLSMLMSQLPTPVSLESTIRLIKSNWKLI